MPRRRLGRTGLEVSACTIGTARMSAGDVDRTEIVATIARALDHGITAFEIDAGDLATAALLGGILRQERAVQRAHIFARATSLVPFDLPSPHVHAYQAYPGDHLRTETDTLLRLLGVERLAVQQIHAWCPEWQGEGDWYDALTGLRDAGKIAGIGVSLFDHDGDAALDVVASGLIDTVQVMYNVFDPSAAVALLPLCATHDVGVIARSPLYFGALTGQGLAGFAPDDWRTAYFHDAHRRETAARVLALARDAAPAAGVADLALRFSADHSAIATVATGLRRRPHLDTAVAAFGTAAAPSPDPAMIARHRWLV